MIPASADPVWDRIRKETEAEVAREPLLASFLHATILNPHTLEAALGFHLAHMLDSPTAGAMLLREVIENAFNSCSSIGEAIRADLQAVEERDYLRRAMAEIRNSMTFRILGWVRRIGNLFRRGKDREGGAADGEVERTGNE